MQLNMDVYRFNYPPIVYKIPNRRARAWPLGRVRARPKVYCLQVWQMLKKFGKNLGYGWILYARYLIVARGPGLSSLQAECAREQRYFAYKVGFTI